MSILDEVGDMMESLDPRMDGEERFRNIDEVVNELRAFADTDDFQRAQDAWMEMGDFTSRSVSSWLIPFLTQEPNLVMKMVAESKSTINAIFVCGYYCGLRDGRDDRPVQE